MAHKHKRHGPKKKHSTRKHKVGALDMKTHGDLVQLAAGAVSGGILKRLGVSLATKMLDKAGVTVSDKTIDVVSIGIGGVGFYLLDHPFLRGISLGVATAGVYDLSAGLKLSGIGMAPLVPFMPRPNVSGATNTPNIAGANVYQFPRPAGVGATRRFAGSNMR